MKNISKAALAVIAYILIAVGMALPALSQPQRPSPAPTRPSFTNGPALGPAGWLGVELGLSSSDNVWSSPLLVKYTITDQVEVRLGTSFNQDRNRVTETIYCPVVPDANGNLPPYDPICGYKTFTPKGNFAPASLWLQYAPGTFGGTQLAVSGGVDEDRDWITQVAAARTVGIAYVIGNVNVEGIENDYRYTGALMASVDVAYRAQVFVEGNASKRRDGASTDATAQVGVSYLLTPRVTVDFAVASTNGNDPVYQVGLSTLALKLR